MFKSPKIKVNGKLTKFSEFEENASGMITLSVSMSIVQLPMLNTSFKNLLVLDNSYNGLERVDDIGNETFPSLRLFNLSNNALSSVKSYVFAHLKEVEILDLSFNCFEKFHYDEVFLKHENLKKLYLNNNQLHSIQSTFSEPRMLSLDFLDFSNNFVNEFANYEIQIHHLNMRNNSLKSVVIFHADEMNLNAQHNQMVHFFAPRGNFKSLNLAHNNVEYLSYVEVEGATVLDLSHNHIRVWSPDESNEYESSNFDDVDVTENDVESPFDIKAMKTAMLERLGIPTTFLNVAHNNIKSIKELAHFKFCQEINLEGNKLTSVYPEAINSLFPMLKKVNVIDNPLTEVNKNRLQQYKTRYSDKRLKLVYEAPPVAKLLLAPIPLVRITIPTLPPHIFVTTLQTTEKIINESETMTTSSLTTQQPQTESTTRKNSVDTSTEMITTRSDEVLPALPLNRTSLPTWMIAIIFTAFIVSSIMFMIHRERIRSVIVYRGFHNEA